MNILAQCLGLSILTTILFFYVQQNRIGMFTEHEYFKDLIAAIVCVCLDILSVIAIVNEDVFTPSVVAVICKLYLSALISVGYSCVAYVLSDLYAEKAYYRVLKLYYLLVFLEIVVLFILPINYYCKGMVVYSYGPSVYWTYLCALVAAIVSTFYVAKHYKKMKPKRRKAVVLWMGIWVCAALIQFYSNETLIIGFACAIGMLVLFFGLENPENYIDRKTGCLNSYALQNYIYKKYEKKSPFSILMISFSYQRGKKVGTEMLEKIMYDMYQFIVPYAHLKVFKSVEGDYVIVAKNELDIADIKARVQKWYKAYINKNDNMSLIEPLYATFVKNEITGEPEEIFQMLHYYQMYDNSLPENMEVRITEQMIESRRAYNRLQEEIFTAVKEERMEMLLQPVYSVKRKQIHAVEALVYLKKNNGTLMGPHEYGVIAEGLGIADMVGEFALEQACKVLKHTGMRRSKMRYIEIPLSVVLFEKKGFVAEFQQKLEEYDVKATRIHISLNTKGLIEKHNIVAGNIMKLYDMGVRFSLDDYGYGQANLNHIIDYPIQMLKMNGRIINGSFENSKTMHVTKSTITMLHELAINVAIAGIDTKDLFEKMQELDADLYVGEYVSGLLTAKEFLQMLERKEL